jgi:dimethylglycine dehydrogenase
MGATLFDLLLEAGKLHDLRPFGMKAMDSLRLEKSYRVVGRELSIEYGALESGLDRFVQLKKPDFLGRAALSESPAAAKNRFVTLEVHGITDADARGSEPIFYRGDLIGRTTSGGYGWRVGKSLALAMVRPDLGEPDTEVTVTILGKDFRATVIPESPYDPRNERLKA